MVIEFRYFQKGQNKPAIFRTFLALGHIQGFPSQFLKSTCDPSDVQSISRIFIATREKKARDVNDIAQSTSYLQYLMSLRWHSPKYYKLSTLPNNENQRFFLLHQFIIPFLFFHSLLLFIVLPSITTSLSFFNIFFLQVSRSLICIFARFITYLYYFYSILFLYFYLHFFCIVLCFIISTLPEDILLSFPPFCYFLLAIKYALIFNPLVKRPLLPCACFRAVTSLDVSIICVPLHKRLMYLCL